MIEYIEDTHFSGTYESINHWEQTVCTFRDAVAKLCAHEISKIAACTKNAIDNEVNSLLLDSSDKRRAIGEHKMLCSFRLGDHEDAKKSEDHIPLKVWKMMTPESSLVKSLRLDL